MPKRIIPAPDPDQIPLLSPAALRPSVRAVQRRRLSSPYVNQVLRLLVYTKAATGSQVLHELFTLRGKQWRYGARVLQQMTSHGLVTTRPVFASRGRASPLAYQVTEAGFRRLGIEPTAKQLRLLTGPALVNRLQFTEVVLTRIAEGWRPVPPARAFSFLKRWALQPYVGKVLSPIDRSRRARLEEVAEDTLMRHFLLVRATDTDQQIDVRVVLQAGEHENLRRHLRQLPSFDLFPEIVFELVIGAPDRLGIASKMLAAYARRRKFQCSAQAIPPFFRRPDERHLTEAQLAAQARQPVGWEPWFKEPAVPQPLPAPASADPGTPA
jgi:hypothetical protein